MLSDQLLPVTSHSDEAALWVMWEQSTGLSLK